MLLLNFINLRIQLAQLFLDASGLLLNICDLMFRLVVGLRQIGKAFLRAEKLCTLWRKEHETVDHQHERDRREHDYLAWLLWLLRHWLFLRLDGLNLGGDKGRSRV